MKVNLTACSQMFTGSPEVLRVRKLLIALVLILCIGAQWPILQSVAWMRMLVSYSKHGTIEMAIAKTFDGKHPCKLCKLVIAGKQAEKGKDQQTSLKKLDLFLTISAPILFPPTEESSPWRYLARDQVITYSPASPPPKAA